ncbi:MAG: 50S ribosomal protein L10 [Candidatus Pacebacteria bacterium]|nr:50S ribosomal protein L10 [Candidatus Paceibacterota bacterium]
MPRTKTQKKEIIEKVKKIALESKTLVFVNFHGIKVADATKIRRKLSSENIGLFVAKKSLMGKAFEGGKTKGAFPTLDGEVALVYGQDIVAPAREIYAFQKEYKDAIKIIGGVFEGSFADKDLMVSIAAIPSQKTLHAMFANVINSPIQGLVIGLSEIAKKKA